MGKFLDKTGLATFWTKIKDTFVKKSDLENYVDLTSDQEIGGHKTFTGDVVYKGWASFDREISLGGLCVGEGDEVSFYPADKQYTITGDNGTITFDPNGVGSDNGGASECGILIKMDDECYAKLEPAALDIRYYNNNFYLSGEESCIGISNADAESNIFAGGIAASGTYGTINMYTSDDEEGSAYLKISSKDDPDNYYTHIGPSFIHFQGDANYFGMWVEDGIMDMGNGEYTSSMGLGHISFDGPDWHMQMTAGPGSDSGVPAICVTNKSNWNNYEYTFPEKSGTFALTNDFKTINGQSIIGSGDITISGGSSDKTYQHDIYIMPGNSNTAGVYIYFTLNTNRSTKYTSMTEICDALYNRGNNVQQQAVSATGRCGSSSSSFSGFIIGVWSTSSWVNGQTQYTLNVAYLTTTGTLSTTSYAASMFSNFRDTVN